ncbi:MAG: hypothetical protein WCK33_11355, partial [Phycisphaerae bacterium]
MSNAPSSKDREQAAQAAELDPATVELLDALRDKGAPADKIKAVEQILAKAPATPGSWGYAVDAYRAAWDALPTPTQDVAAAKKLVADSGVSNPRLVIAAFSELPDSVND